MSAVGKPVFDTGPDSGLPPAVRAFRSVLLLAQRLRQLMDDRLRSDGLTTQQAALLTAVIALGRPAVTEAARALGSTHQNVAQLVAALQRKGLLRVEPDPTDRRRRRLVATERNDRYWHERDPGDVAAMAAWFGALSPEELRMLGTLAGRVLEHLDPLDRRREPGNP